MKDPRQRAAVFVSGAFVGNWINTFHRGSDTFVRYDDFYIPESFVAGKQQLIITFQTLEGYQFGETVYEIFPYEL